MQYDPCVFCKSDDISLDCSISIMGKLDADVTRCNRCGLLFVNPVLEGAKAAELYDGYWDPRSAGRKEIDRRYLRQYRWGKAYGRRLSRLRPGGRMLEVGCGQGFFLKGVADHCDWEVEGIDVATGAEQFGREKLGVTIREERFEEIEFPEQSFDLIRAKDVLEHVPDPMGFLGKIYRLLRPQGWVELWLPNGALDLAPARRAFRKGGRVQMNAGHVLFIVPRVLRGMLETVGFRVEKAEVSGFRYALKALGILRVPSRPGMSPAGAGAGTGGRQSLDAWTPPPHPRGLKGTLLYARFREWRSHHPALPAFLPLGFRQYVIARKPG